MMIKHSLLFSILLITTTLSYAETLDDFFNKNKAINDDIEIRLAIKEKAFQLASSEAYTEGSNDLAGRSGSLMRKDGGSYARYAVKTLVDACNNIGPYQSRLDDDACKRLEGKVGGIK
ncbi:hypothetical protein ACLAI9_03175 [Klebsiella pneumoniae]|uniref:hypothetical protein n=1 Tax=Klebsiella pneumoniae TaxID=573 RepID=UPI000D59BF4F|nr:hypothetical protein [Klebsiella pneumoniae]MBC4633699.1 hypothetical protein [Klebsiella pneumoniae]MBC4701377.1 hypothetical protein [Klebsiella pneumoniae]MBC4788209.1 hypothetical protein [Klebsiella pneumoniae]MBK2366727.1 hypothetical protein [Klebsiella pneumoniae]MBL2832219.1 hypothetical protein [Klebsiella pneumoniae]